MKNTDDVKIDSELISNSKQYRFDTTKRKATTAGKDYLCEGKYNLSLSMKGAEDDVLLSVYDTQPPIYTENVSHIIVEQGIRERELREYFPIFDYDDLTTLALFKEEINLNKPQKVRATAIAHDSHGNQSEKEVVLQIVSRGYAKKNKNRLSKKADQEHRAKVFLTKQEDEKEEYKEKLTKKREAYLAKEQEIAGEEVNFKRCDEATKPYRCKERN